MTKTKIATIALISLCLLVITVGAFNSLEMQKQIGDNNTTIKQLTQSIESLESKIASNNEVGVLNIPPNPPNILPESTNPDSINPIANTITVPTGGSKTQTEDISKPSVQSDDQKTSTPAQNPIVENMWETNGEVFTVWSVYSLNANLFLGDLSAEQIANCTNIRPIKTECGTSYQLLFKYVNNLTLDESTKVRVWGKYKSPENDPRNKNYEFTEIYKIEKV
jgi:hypothetical protein